MLSPEEKRFVRYWEEQRKGGRNAYFLLYIISGTIVTSIVVSFVGAMLYSFSMPERPWIIPIISFVITTALTIYSWKKNERRLKELIRREILEGQQQDDNYSDEKLN